jgi:hypothetical protein
MVPIKNRVLKKVWQATACTTSTNLTKSIKPSIWTYDPKQMSVCNTLIQRERLAVSHCIYLDLFVHANKSRYIHKNNHTAIDHQVTTR